MSPLARLFVTAGLLLMYAAAHGENAIPEKFRIVHLRIFGADGKPAAARDVTLRGWERRALGPLFDDDDVNQERKKGWLFTTDADGNIAVPIGDFAGWLDEKGRPGWGVYGFVVHPGSEDAGGVSQRFWLGGPTETLQQAQETWGSEWGPLLPLPVEGLQITMALATGFTFTGTVLDDDSGKPVANQLVDTWNDLRIDTHTGFGGEIFRRSTRTDEHGDFEIKHEFFHRTYVSFSALWLKTRFDDVWREQKDDVLEPPRDSSLKVEVRVCLHPHFHYRGRVTNFAGKPVSGADIIVGISHQPQADSWADSHHFEKATTDASGRYDLAASSPWATFLGAEKKELGRVDLKWPGWDMPPIPPGRYNLKFPEHPATDK